MEVSITCVTRNRKFTKTLSRYGEAIRSLERLASWVSTSGLPFDILQIIFLDRNSDYARAIGCKNDRIFQVEIAAPGEESFDNETAFIACVAERFQTAIRLCRLTKNIELKLIDAIDQFKRN